MVVGRVVFVVGLHYKKDGKKILEDKVKKHIQDDVKTGNF